MPDVMVILLEHAKALTPPVLSFTCHLKKPCALYSAQI